VGFEDGNIGGGRLISDVSKHPYSIILFDEIEKAHPDVSNVLLQMMDEAKITGSNGKSVDIKNCIIILTSNLGARDNESNNIGFGMELGKSNMEDKAVKDFFKPEMRNRLDMICKFGRLDDLAVKKIVNKFLAELKSSLAIKNINITIAEKLIDHLAQVGYDDKMGARPINRKIDSLIRVPLSKRILFDGLENCDLHLDWADDELKVMTVLSQKQLGAPKPKVSSDGFIVLDQFKPKD